MIGFDSVLRAGHWKLIVVPGALSGAAQCRPAPLSSLANQAVKLACLAPRPGEAHLRFFFLTAP